MIKAYLIALQETQCDDGIIIMNKNEIQAELQLFEVGLSWMKQILPDSQGNMLDEACFVEMIEIFDILLQKNMTVR